MLGAERLSAADAFAGIHRLADLRRAAEALWDGVDLRAFPTVPRAWRVADLEGGPHRPERGAQHLHECRRTARPLRARGAGPVPRRRLPGGRDAVAPAGCDGLLASVGAALHRAAGVPVGALGLPVPDADLPPAPAPGGIETAVMDAHLSGMPLDRGLAVLGGTFRRAVDTAPEYRLHAPPGGPPARPGLVRVEGGSAIATDVWRRPLRRRRPGAGRHRPDPPRRRHRAGSPLNRDRPPVAFFLAADPEVVAAPLRSCIAEVASPLYTRVTVAEHLRARLDSTYGP